MKIRYQILGNCKSKWLGLAKNVFIVAIYLGSIIPYLVQAKGLTTLPRLLPPANVDITVSQIIASGFSRPIQVTHAGDGSNRLFVVEQDGTVDIIKAGVVLTTSFLNISSLVRSPSDGGGSEQGLLGLAFDPDYATNGHFYVNYTRTGDGDTVIARYTVSGNPDVANAGSATILLTIDQPFSNHNGGQLLFSPIDNYLYIAMGDGGSADDPQDHGQNKNTLLGAMLRINVTGVATYSIPVDNPYVGQDGADEIWAIGLRNPWRFSFDRLTGDLYIGDVGQGVREEISYQAANTAGGLNFGWDCREGSIAHSNDAAVCDDPGVQASLVDPIAEYDHGFGIAVTGGFVYRGSLYPALQERYFYADYGSGRIWSMYKTGPTSWSTPQQELDTNFNISAFGEDEQGELYVVDYSGNIRRLADVNGPSPNLSGSTKTVSAPSANPGELITYTIRLNNSGGLTNTQTVYLSDTVPAGLGYVPTSLTASQGNVNASAAPLLRWSGTVTTSVITITYRVTATGQITGTITNQAVITGTAINPVTLTQSILVPRPALTSTAQDFLVPGTQPNQLSAAIPTADGCNFCHTDPIYDRWRGSMMSQAGRDPLFWAALSVANSKVPDIGDFCLRCHTPKGWLEGRSHPADGTALQSDDISNGITCEVCHRLVDPLPSATDEAVAIDAVIRAAITVTLPATHTGSAMLIVDPQDRRRGPFDVNPPHGAYQTDFLGQFGSAITQSRLCGSCHNIDNPLLSWDSNRGQFWPNSMNAAAPSFAKGQLFPLERTYDEWLNSTFAITGVILPQFAGAKADGRVASCQDCHLPRTTGIAAEAIHNPVFRDCQTTGCLPAHTLVGGNAWVPEILQDTRWRFNSAAEAVILNNTITEAQSMLQKAATLSVTLTISGAQKIATVQVTNDTGHKLPTGYPEGRRMWLNLKAYNITGSLIYESGAYNFTSAQLTEDPAAKIYEVKQGLTPELAALVNLSAGPTFHFGLNNTVIKDNRIPPRGYTLTAYNQPGLVPVGANYADGQYWDETQYLVPDETERVTAILYYQTASKAYIDFLRANGGPDGATLGQLWDSSKSPPTVMDVAFFPSIPYYFPIIFK